MRTADFDFALPPELIAQQPTGRRDESRLLTLRRDTGHVAHHRFRDLPSMLQTGDVLVLNNSRVIPARLRGTNALTAGRFEILLLEEIAVNEWWVMLRPGKRARRGTEILLRDANDRPAGVRATVLDTNEEGHRLLRFSGTEDIAHALEQIGEAPLPPYIHRANAAGLSFDKERYQTVFAETPGSVAAPTAGLHFTESLLSDIHERGVQVRFVTLHVGLGTFAPVKAATISAHRMHEERYDLSPETARAIADAKREGRRVVAVGTTTVRVLESVAAEHGGAVEPGAGRTRIFIFPPYEFKVVDALLTNFHLPRSTLLMLVSAFAAPGQTRGRELILSAYAEAIRERYHFFSYGDAMFIE
jgi:S-adenosylmethionine:tRNA ribosyltransferase-isomerase